MRLLKLLIAFALCLSLSVTASAHSGRTDSNGGHTDSETGEYHYHHGYPAHQHYDMDDDGYLDCPYSFDDETGSSGNKTESKKKTSKKGTIGDYVKTIFCIGLVLFFLVGFFVDGRKN